MNFHLLVYYYHLDLQLLYSLLKINSQLKKYELIFHCIRHCVIQYVSHNGGMMTTEFWLDISVMVFLKGSGSIIHFMKTKLTVIQVKSQGFYLFINLKKSKGRKVFSVHCPKPRVTSTLNENGLQNAMTQTNTDRLDAAVFSLSLPPGCDE